MWVKSPNSKIINSKSDSPVLRHFMAVIATLKDVWTFFVSNLPPELVIVKVGLKSTKTFV